MWLRILRDALRAPQDEGMAIPFPRCTRHPSFCSNGTKPRLNEAVSFRFPLKTEGSGAPNGAPCLLPDTAKRTAPVTRYSRVPHYEGRSPFGAPLRIDRTCVLPRPGPALPGITGCKRESVLSPPPSPAPVQRAPRSPNTCRTGMMPRPPARRADSPNPQNPRPLRQKPSPRMTSLTTSGLIFLVGY